MTHKINNLWLDRLVDGELLEPERRALLERLETEPDGWRRCALAFLEAQAWREATGGLAAATAATVPGVPRVIRRERASWVGRVRGLAAAAAVVGAFGLGWLSRGTDSPAEPVVVVQAAPVSPERSKPADVTASVAQKTVAARTEPGDSAPAASGRMLDLRQLERAGYRVEERPGMLVSTAAAGTPVIEPARELRIRFVGRPVY
jgi:anti-sigma factor RsiW